MEKPRSLSIEKTILILIVLSGLSFASGALTTYYLGWSRSSVSQSALPAGQAPAKSGEAARQAIVALGRLEPEGGVIHIGVPLGDRLSEMFVKEGEEVQAGQPLARLESYPERKADRDLAQSQLEEAKHRKEAVTTTGQAAIAEAEIHRKQVEELGKRDLEAQKAKVRLLEAQWKAAAADLKRLKALSPSSVPEQQMEMQVLAVTKAEEELAGAQAILKKTETGLETGVKAADAQLQTARATLCRFQAEIPLKSLEKMLALTEERFKHTTILAPAAGKILKIIARPGETLGSRTILQMADTSHMIAIAEVYETELQRVRQEAPASITSPALPAPLKGSVMHKGSMIAKNRLLDLDPSAPSDQRVVEVKIQLEASAVAAGFINLQVKISISP